MPGAEAVEKGVEGVSRLAKILGPTIGGTVTPIAMDYRMNDDPDAIFGVTTFKDLFSGNMDKSRIFNLGLNTLIGATGGSMIANKQIAGGAGVLTLAPAKDLIMNSLNASKDIKEAIQENAQATADAAEATSSADKARLLLLGALGAGALGLGGLGLYKYMTRDPQKDTARLKMKLPGKKGDPESAAEVELPINMPEFSPALTEGLDRAVRLRTRKNIRANSLKRDLETGKLIPYDEWKEKYGDAEDDRHGQELPPAFQNQLAKVAGTNEIHERLGDMTTSLLPALGGAIVGRQAAEGYGITPWVGGTAGALVAGILPTLIGRGLASLSEDRTPEEQMAQDEKTPWLEYILPGYAAYQSEKRDSVRRVEMDRLRTQLGQASYAAGNQTLPPSFVGGTSMPTAISEGDIDDILDSDLDEEEDDDYSEKGASAPPPPPGGGGGGGAPPPSDPRMRRQVNPNQNNVAGGISRQGDPRKAQEFAERVGQKLVLSQQKPQMPPRRPVTLADIHYTMSDMGERLHNLSFRNYGQA